MNKTQLNWIIEILTGAQWQPFRMDFDYFFLFGSIRMNWMNEWIKTDLPTSVFDVEILFDQLKVIIDP